MEVKMALIICLSVVFIFTLGIVSCTLRDKNFKVRFDDRTPPQGAGTHQKSQTNFRYQIRYE